MPLVSRTVLMALVVGLVCRPRDGHRDAILGPSRPVARRHEFQTWETPPVFARTYYVDQADPRHRTTTPAAKGCRSRRSTGRHRPSTGRPRRRCRRVYRERVRRPAAVRKPPR